MFPFISEVFKDLTSSFHLSTSVSFALALAFFCLFLLALRELASWFLKTNHIQAEILGLQDQIRDIENLLLKQKEDTQNSEENENKKIESDLPDSINKQFEKDLEAPREQFPLQ